MSEYFWKISQEQIFSRKKSILVSLYVRIWQFRSTIRDKTVSIWQENTSGPNIYNMKRKGPFIIYIMHFYEEWRENLFGIQLIKIC